MPLPVAISPSHENLPRELSCGFQGGPINGAYDWHRHSHHQLIHARAGLLTVETETARYILPPNRALWIGSGVVHRTTARRAVVGSIFFSPVLVRWKAPDICVVEAPGLLVEMVAYAARWPEEDNRRSELRRSYFAAASLLAREWVRRPVSFSLPTTEREPLAGALRWAEKHLAEANEATMAWKAGLSVRSLRRHFRSELGLSWRAYSTRARLLAAMERLTRSNSTITEIAHVCGFQSASAFTFAFRRMTGETPRSYRTGRGISS